MKSTIRVFGVFMAALLLAACSPEVKLQNIMTRDGGRWDVDEVIVTVTTNTEPPPVVETREFNVAEALFYDGGTGVWIQYDTTLLVNVATYFEWENTANSITVNLEGMPEEIEYNVSQESKDEQWWAYESTEMVGELSVITAIQMHLVREPDVANK